MHLVQEAPVSENLTLNGRIDRIDRVEDGSLRIIGYKTGKIPEQVDLSWVYQIELLLRERLGIWDPCCRN